MLELVSEAGRLTQALLWTGPLAEVVLAEAGTSWRPGVRVARLLPQGLAHAGDPGPLVEADSGWVGSPAGADDAVLAYLYEADPSLERARLLGGLARDLGLRPVHPAVGVLTGREAIDSPWLRRFEVLEVLPWRRKAVAAAVRALDGGIVTVKTRGKAVDPDALQRGAARAGPNTPDRVRPCGWASGPWRSSQATGRRRPMAERTGPRPRRNNPGPSRGQA
ncbi:MAG: hypothetical protein KatS3mg103_0636 [Phycisphaerales bacterium]|nr:MAG: hypothetical protein KatS3mg103_0636 [Phycisphaerales bacterium]